MVLLTATPAVVAAVEHYNGIRGSGEKGENETCQLKFGSVSLGDPLNHDDLIKLSRVLQHETQNAAEEATRGGPWRLDTLLRGAKVYQPPPPPKAEPTSEYKALMKRLREEEEERQYERMINPPVPLEAFGQRFPNAGHSFGPSIAGPVYQPEEIDEVTYADVNRQMVLIINVLVSIIACSIAIWIAARRWDVPQRLALSMFGSVLVAAAEVAIYWGYVRRIQEAKGKEAKKIETREVVESWVLDGSKQDAKSAGEVGMRFRKGKHR